MTHYQDAEDLMPLDELIESILQVWLNPRHPDAWGGSYNIIDDELHDGHECMPRLPRFLVEFQPTPWRQRPVVRRQMYAEDELRDYQVTRARDLCEVFHADEVTIATRISPDDRPVAYRTVHSREYIERNRLLEERREANEKIKAASTPEALRAQKERAAEQAKQHEEWRRRADRRLFGIGVRK